MSAGPEGTRRVFRLPALSYLVVLFLLAGTTPVAFTASGAEGEVAHVGPQTLLLLVPVVAAVFIARWATLVDDGGLTVRAAVGSRRLSWTELRGLAVSGTSVYAVLGDGSVRLPCVHVNQLGELARASGGRLPEMADPVPKYAPQRRRHR